MYIMKSGKSYSILLEYLFRGDEISALNAPLLEIMFKNATDYLNFSLYPYDMLEALIGQYFHEPRKFQTINPVAMLENCWLALATRSAHRNIPFQFQPYSDKYASDPDFCGLLYSIENPGEITGTEAYLYSILMNLMKNPLKFFVLEADHPQRDFKIVVVIRRQTTNNILPGAPIITIEVIDNGPGFDLNSIRDSLQNLKVRGRLQQALTLFNQQEQKALTTFMNLPYATDVSLNSLLNTVFIERLSGAKKTTSMSSGLGLSAFRILASQMMGKHLVGMNHPGLKPFSQGARFMLLLPAHPHGILPDLNLPTKDAQHGDPAIVWFGQEEASLQ